MIFFYKEIIKICFSFHFRFGYTYFLLSMKLYSFQIKKKCEKIFYIKLIDLEEKCKHFYTVKIISQHCFRVYVVFVQNKHHYRFAFYMIIMRREENLCVHFENIFTEKDVTINFCSLFYDSFLQIMNFVLVKVNHNSLTLLGLGYV